MEYLVLTPKPNLDAERDRILDMLGKGLEMRAEILNEQFVERALGPEVGDALRGSLYHQKTCM
jgi:hypothetical protein